MEWLENSWRWLIAQYVDWNLVLRFIEVVIWPIIALIGLAMIKPGRVVDALLNGGELGLGPATMRFAKRVDEIAASVEDDEETASEPNSANNPLTDAADPYTTVMNAWGKVVEGLEEAVRKANLAPVNKRRPMETVAQLRAHNLIGRKLEKNIQEIWDFRNRVMNAGSRQLGRLGLSQLAADDFYAAADRVRRGILRAIAYRESKGSLPSQTMPPLSAAPHAGEPLN
ncbi:MAG: hypothetical protein AB7T58_11865 [Hyphomonadaceae bacterium]